MPGSNAQTTQVDDGIWAIDVEYIRPLLDSSHLVIEDGRAAFVDTGTNDSVPLLLDALHQQDLDVGDVDFVFLTHVHLDHAGGAGLLMQRLPHARCVLHPRGAPHMVDPEFNGEKPDMFICGNDDDAKRIVGELIDDLGWPPVIDLGDISMSRYLEPMAMVWIAHFFNQSFDANHAFKLLRK